MLDQEKNKSAESLTNLCHLHSVLYSLLFYVHDCLACQGLIDCPSSFVRWFFLTWFLLWSFFFLNVFCSELSLIEYNIFKETSLKVQHFPALVELHDRSLSWSFVCCCSDQLQLSRANCSEVWAGCVSLSVQ